MTSVHNALDPESLYINWPRNCIGTQKNHNFRKNIRMTNSDQQWMSWKKLYTTSPNQIQFNSTLLFILQDWLWTSKAANVSCTRFCSKATELHATIMCREFDPGCFSRTENCTWQFTDQFVIITEGFRALSKLDLESLYLTSPKQCIWTQKSRLFRNTTERQT